MAGVLRSLSRGSSSPPGDVFPVFALAGSFSVFLDLVFELYDDFIARTSPNGDSKKKGLIIVFGTPVDELGSLLSPQDTTSLSLSNLMTIRRVLLSQSIRVVSIPSILHFRAFIYSNRLYAEYSAIFIWGLVSAHASLSSEWSFQGLSKSLALTCDFLNLHSVSDAPLVVFGDIHSSINLQFTTLNINPIAFSRQQQLLPSSLATPVGSTPRSGVVEPDKVGQIPVTWALRRYLRVFLSRPSAQNNWRVYELDR